MQDLVRVIKPDSTPFESIDYFAPPPLAIAGTFSRQNTGVAPGSGEWNASGNALTITIQINHSNNAGTDVSNEIKSIEQNHHLMFWTTNRKIIGRVSSVLHSTNYSTIIIAGHRGSALSGIVNTTPTNFEIKRVIWDASDLNPSIWGDNLTPETDDLDVIDATGTGGGGGGASVVTSLPNSPADGDQIIVGDLTSGLSISGWTTGKVKKGSANIANLYPGDRLRYVNSTSHWELVYESFTKAIANAISGTKGIIDIWDGDWGVGPDDTTGIVPNPGTRTGTTTGDLYNTTNKRIELSSNGVGNRNIIFSTPPDSVDFLNCAFYVEAIQSHINWAWFTVLGVDSSAPVNDNSVRNGQSGLGTGWYTPTAAGVEGWDTSTDAQNILSVCAANDNTNTTINVFEHIVTSSNVAFKNTSTTKPHIQWSADTNTTDYYKLLTIVNRTFIDYWGEKPTDSPKGLRPIGRAIMTKAEMDSVGNGGVYYGLIGDGGNTDTNKYVYIKRFIFGSTPMVFNALGLELLYTTAA